MSHNFNFHRFFFNIKTIIFWALVNLLKTIMNLGSKITYSNKIILIEVSSRTEIVLIEPFVQTNIIFYGGFFLHPNVFLHPSFSKKPVLSLKNDF